MGIFGDDEDEPLAQFLESELFSGSDQDEDMEDSEGEVKRKSKRFKVEDGSDGIQEEEERVTKKMRVMEDEDELEGKEKQEQEEEDEEEKREARAMKLEEEEEEEEEKVNALLSSSCLSPSTEVDAKVECASSPSRMSQTVVDHNTSNNGASTSNSMRQVPNGIDTGILSKVPPELLHHILKFLSPEDLVVCSLICKFFNFAASDESLWRRLYCMRWGLLPTKKPRECAWKKLYIQRDADDMVEFVRNTPTEFKEYYIQMQAAKRSQAPLPSQINDDRIILDKTVADQVDTWKKSKGLGDNVVVDHTCSGEMCTYFQIGDVFVCEKTGHVHVCDDTCRETISDPTNGLLVCTISGLCFERMLSLGETEQDGEQQQGGAADEPEPADEAEPFMGSGRFARAYIMGYNCDDEKELEAALRFC